MLAAFASQTVSSSCSPGTSRGRGLGPARGTWARPWALDRPHLPSRSSLGLQPPMPRPGTRPTFTPARQQHLRGWQVAALLRPGPTWPPLRLSRDGRADWKQEGLDASPALGSPGEWTRGARPAGVPCARPTPLPLEPQPSLPRGVLQSNPMDYAWGANGLDAIITQVQGPCSAGVGTTTLLWTR